MKMKKEEEERYWLSLPPLLWLKIGRYLRVLSPLNLLRLRNVCSLFRSLFPLYPSTWSRRLRRRRDLFPPRYSHRSPNSLDAFVTSTTLYRLDRPFHTDTDRRRSWLLKVQEPPLPYVALRNRPPPRLGVTPVPDRFRILDVFSSPRNSDPFSCTLCNNLDGGGFDLINDFHLTELTTCYEWSSCRARRCIILEDVTKLILAPNFSSSAIFLICIPGQLRFAKAGKDIIKEMMGGEFKDIILYRNQPYAVDDRGSLFLIDKELNLIQHSPPFSHLRRQHRHLVNSEGESLYLVDRHLEKISPYPKMDGKQLFRTVGFKVHKLDEEQRRWVEVKSLGQQAFVLTFDCCFAIKAKEYVGFRENCIYFTELQFDDFGSLEGHLGAGGCVFSLEDDTMEELPCTPGYSQLFWPDHPPILGKCERKRRQF